MMVLTGLKSSCNRVAFLLKTLGKNPFPRSSKLPESTFSLGSWPFLHDQASSHIALTSGLLHHHISFPDPDPPVSLASG